MSGQHEYGDDDPDEAGDGEQAHGEAGVGHDDAGHAAALEDCRGRTHRAGPPPRTTGTR